MTRAVVAPPQRAALRPQQHRQVVRQLQRVQVAAAEAEPAVEAEEEEPQSEALYARFAELIDASMLSFHTGDRVRGRAGWAGQAQFGGAPPARGAAAAAAPFAAVSAAG